MSLKQLLFVFIIGGAIAVVIADLFLWLFSKALSTNTFNVVLSREDEAENEGVADLGKNSEV